MKKQRIYKIMKISLIVLVFAGISGMILNQSCSSVRYDKEDINMRKIENSKQYGDGKFHNKVAWEQPSFFEYSGTMWDFVFKGGDRTPEESLPRKDVDLKYFNGSDANALNSTWLGHSSLLLNIDGYRIVTDPVYEKKVSFFGPTRFNGEVPFDPNSLQDIDIVIISHNHYDHMNKYSVKLLAGKTKLFIVPLAVGAELENWGIPRDKIVELDWWEEYNHDDRLMIAATPSQHFSGRSLTDRNETLWASWVIKAEYHNVFFSGDGGYNGDFKVIGEKYGPFDMTFMECGAYNKQWHHIHMYPEETVQAHLDLKGNILHPIHWGTFNLALHPWYEPMVRASRAAEEHNITLATPVVGETTVFGKYIPTERWWLKSSITVEVD